MTEAPATCGQGLVAQAPLPTQLAALLAAVGAVLEVHTEALELDDPDARRELEAYQVLAADHRDVAWRLQAIGERMAGYVDLPMAPHDPAKMAGPRPLEAFERLVAIEQQLLELLQQRARENRAMLREMRS